MKNITNLTLAFLILNFTFFVATAQVSINENNTNPDPSAMLDVSSPDKGVLIPRLSANERQNIADPAIGLMVYDSTNQAFYYFNGIGWLELLSNSVRLLADTDGDTKIQVEESDDEDEIRIDLGGTEYFKLDSGRIGIKNTLGSIYIGEEAGSSDDYSIDRNNVGIGTKVLKSNTDGGSNVGGGFRALEDNTEGFGNIGIGYYALHSNTTGQSSVGVGYYSLGNNTSGRDNTSVGYFSLGNNTTGRNNTAFGYFSLGNNTTGEGNTTVGQNSLNALETGNYNTSLGYLAGNRAEGSYSIYIGSEAGRYDTSSYKLYIEPTDADSTQALIFGNFDQDRLRINGTLNINGSYALPKSDGTANQYLKTDGTGNAAWSALSGEDFDINYSDFDLSCLELVGSTGLGGFPTSVAADGDYAYIVDSSSDDLRVIDATDKTNPTLIGQLNIGGSPNAVAVADDYAYVVDSDTDDLKVIDISDKTNPFLTKSFGLSDCPEAIAVDGDYAYVVDSESEDLKVIDVSDKMNPVQTGSIGLGGSPEAIVVLSDYAYIVDQGSNDLKVIDISDKTNPTQTASLGIGGSPNGIDVLGNYVYIIDLNTNDLKVIDVSDKTNPMQTASLTIDNTPISVNAFSNYVAVAGLSSEQLKIVDVSDPANPSLIGSEDIGLAPTAGTLFGNFSYIADEAGAGLQVIRLACDQNLVINPISLELEAQPPSWMEKDHATTYTNRQVGIGTASPSSALEINGTVTATSFSGDGTNLSNTGDDLGNHTATQTLNLSNNNISNGGTITANTFVGDGSSLTNLPNQVPIGTIQMWPTSSPPSGWLICNGGSFNTSTYPELNSLLGGNALTNFNGRFPLGVGNSGTSGATNHNISSDGGEEKHTLSISEMPNHSHGAGSLSTSEPYLSQEGSGTQDKRDGGGTKLFEYSSITGNTASVGSGQAHNNMPPFYTINFIIKAK